MKKKAGARYPKYLKWSANVPPGASLTFQTRAVYESGDVSEWSEEYTDPHGSLIASPPSPVINIKCSMDSPEPACTTPILYDVWIVLDDGTEVPVDIFTDLEESTNIEMTAPAPVNKKGNTYAMTFDTSPSLPAAHYGYRVVYRSFRTTGFANRGFRVGDCHLLFADHQIETTRFVSPYVFSKEHECFILPVGAKRFRTDARRHVLPPDTYVVAIAFTGETANQQKVFQIGEKKVAPILSLVDVLLGDRMLDTMMFEDVVEIKKGEVAGISKVAPPERNEAMFPIREIAPNEFEILAQGFQNLESKVEKDRRKVELALRWYLKGVQEKIDSDKYLAFWIVLEICVGCKNPQTIAKHISQMLDNMNIDTIKQNLHFRNLDEGLGGERSDIVHDGKQQVDPVKLRMLEEIAQEILRNELNLPLAGFLPKYFPST